LGDVAILYTQCVESPGDIKVWVMPVAMSFISDADELRKLIEVLVPRVQR
jgi:hypothetical protein